MILVGEHRVDVLERVLQVGHDAGLLVLLQADEPLTRRRGQFSWIGSQSTQKA